VKCSHRSRIPPKGQRIWATTPCPRLFKVALLDLTVPVASQELGESVPIPAIVSVAVAAADGENSNWEARLIDSRSVGCKIAYLGAHHHRAAIVLSTPQPHPFQGSRRTLSPPTSHLARYGDLEMMLCGCRDRTVPPRPLRYVYQFL